MAIGFGLSVTRGGQSPDAPVILVALDGPGVASAVEFYASGSTALTTLSTPVMKKGDRRPHYRAVLTINSLPVDLSGATAVRFIMKTSPGATPKVDSTVTVLSPASAGIVEYSWLPPDTNTSGSYIIEVEVDWAGEKQTFPASGYLTLKIEDDLG